ncbi:MAG: hypothetical protein LBU87_04415 [Lactobacillales bacterium]|jgi:NTP pyrophosphatase (non-canonical NTP hydrolase)|nr:hypothetical protein [Lactobacillales bacterium]
MSLFDNLQNFDNQEIEDIYHTYTEVFGKNAQLFVLLEEMSELQKEILKNINRGKDNIMDIADEAADVFIMLEQMQRLYGIKEEIARRIPEKLKKAKKRLEEKK